MTKLFYENHVLKNKVLISFNNKNEIMPRFTYYTPGLNNLVLV